jgi:uncharacterized protein (DUF924 family)
MSSRGARAVLDFWFADALVSPEALEAQVERWFGSDPELDREIADRFAPLLERAGRGELDDWLAGDESALALVILLDQFPRNVFRGSRRAFAMDAKAQAVAAAAIDAGVDRRLHPLEASFLYLPFEHAEDAALQERSVELFEALRARAPAELRAQLDEFARYAHEHRDIVHRFGRFPHRNHALGRASTPAERAYLESGGTTYGVPQEKS